MKFRQTLQQVDMQLYCMGEEADSILAQLISAQRIGKVQCCTMQVGRFDVYFKVRRNTISESAKFNAGLSEKINPLSNALPTLRVDQILWVW